MTSSLLNKHLRCGAGALASASNPVRPVFPPNGEQARLLFRVFPTDCQVVDADGEGSPAAGTDARHTAGVSAKQGLGSGFDLEKGPFLRGG